MSKQVVVTDRDGNTYTYGADGTEVDDLGNLVVYSGQTTVARHRDWAHATVQEKPFESTDLKPSRDITVSVEAPVQDFSKGGFVSKPDCTRLCCPSCCDKECK